MSAQIDLGWYADLMSLVASLLLTWPVLRASFRLREADRISAPSPRQINHDSVLTQVWASAGQALREPQWSGFDHFLTVTGFLLVLVATALKFLSH